MATPAAVLNILLTANATQATAALGKTQGQLVATSKTATATSATVKKAMLGIGIAAAGAGAALFKIGEEFDDAYDKIQSRTGATEREMRKLKAAFRDVVTGVPATFEDAATAVGDLNTRMGLTGRPLRRMSKQMTELSRITETDVKGNVEAVAKAFTDWEVSTKDQSKTLDGFYRLSTKSGISVSDLARSVQEFGSPLRQLGFSLEEAAAMFANFERAGVNTSTMVPGLKLAISNLTRPTDNLAASMAKLGIETGKPDKALRQVFDILSDENRSQVERTGLAMDVFGKRAGADMAEAISQGRFQVDELVKSFRNSEGAIRDQGRETMDLKEHWQKFKSMLKVELEPVAEDVFSGLGDLMKDVTKAFKRGGLDEVIQTLIDKLGEAAPKVLEAGKKIAGSFIKGFINADVWGKLTVAAIVGTALTKRGGFFRIGKDGGRSLGKGVIVGIALAIPALVEEAFNFGKKLGYELKRIGPKIGEDFVNGIIAAVNFGIRQINEAMDKANVFAFAGVDAPNIGEIGNVDFTANLGEILKTEGIDAAIRHLEDMGNTSAEAEKKVGKLWHKLYEVNPAAKAVREGADKAGRGVKDFGGKTQDTARVVNDAFRDIERGGDRAFTRVADKGRDKSGDLRRTVSGNVGGMVNAVGDGLQTLIDNTNRALRGFGAKTLAFTAKKVGGDVAAGAQAITRQRGGPINVGKASGDSVPAMLERGEYVLNRKAVQAFGQHRLDAINFGAAPRFATGGLVQALGPYDISPIQYDPDHAGGNSHWHIHMATQAAVVAIGRELQRMGFMVGEHPAFGGIQGSHSATGGHPVGLAIDVNSAADETRAETAAVARLLRGRGGATPELAKMLLQGPDGPLKSMGQGALDKVHAAAQRFLNKKTMVEGAEPGAAGGSFGKAALAGLWRGGGGAASVANVAAAIALAESSGNPRAFNQNTNGTWDAGLWQINQIHGYPLNRLYDPAFNARAAVNVWRGSGGFSPWVQFNNGEYRNFLQRGGFIGLQRGGNGRRRNPGGGSAGPRPETSSGWRRPADLLDKIRDAAKRTGVIDEQIDNAETLASFFTSEAGVDLGPGERASITGLYQTLKANLAERLGLIGRAFQKLPAGKGQNIRADLRQQLTDIQGVTGQGGRLLMVGQRLDELGAPQVSETASETASMLAELRGQRITELERLLAVRTLQDPIFTRFFSRFPVMHDGGIVPGPAGANVPIMAQAGERVVPNNAGPSILYADIYIGGEKIDERVEVELRDQLGRAVRSAQTGPAVNRKAVYR